jgi:hypothetical protein
MGNTWKIVLATLVIFTAGAVTGGLLVNHARGGRNARSERVAQQRAPTWQPGAGEMLQPGTNEIRPLLEKQRMDFVLRVQRELRLDPQQHERIERVVREGQERTKEFWEKNQPELRRMVQETREKIRAELSPEQRKRFEELSKQQRPPRSPEAGGAGRTAGEPRRPGASGETAPPRPNRQRSADAPEPPSPGR